MKKIIKVSIYMLVLILGFGILLDVNATDTRQDFDTIKLRHGYKYHFSDNFEAGSKYIWINGYGKTQFIETDGYDYNGAGVPNFAYSAEMLKRGEDYGYHLVPEQKQKKAYFSTDWYHISYHPAVRKPNNLVINYITEYQTLEGNAWSAKKTHTEHQPYTITWCGDGVVDDYIDEYTKDHIKETCDPADETHQGWENGTCDPVTCEPVRIPTCNGLTVTPDEGTATVESTAVCTGYNVNEFKIDCGNGQIFTGNGSNSGIETFTKTCTYTEGGTYTSRCFINETETNFSCQDTVKVTGLNPGISITKIDQNSNDLDGIISTNDLDNADSTSTEDSQTIYKGDKAIFKIHVKNTGNEDLKNIKLIDPEGVNCSGNLTLPGTYPNTWSNFVVYGDGNHNDNIFQVGEEFYYTCVTEDNQTKYVNKITVTANGVTTNEEVDDFNISNVLIEEIPACEAGISGTVDSPLTENTSNLCDNAAETAVNFIENTENGIENYSWACQLGDTIKTGGNCSASYIIPGTLQYDLALTKEVTTVGPYNIGDEVSYKIIVTNQGDIDANNIEVTDYIPTNMELVTGDNWSTVVGGETVNKTITSLNAGESSELVIKLKILAGATGTITNWAEISADDGDDCDSDSAHNIDKYTTDYSESNPNPAGCNRGDDKDEDDNDPASITIGSSVSCEAGITGGQASPINSSTPNLCSNAGETVTNFISTVSGNTTLYTWNCTDGTTIYTGGNCSASYTSGGGGTVYGCLDVIATGNEVTCIGNRYARSFGVICDTITDGNTLSNTVGIFKLKEGVDNGHNFAKFNCTTVNQPRCFVYSNAATDYGNKSWKTSMQCKLDPTSCGNGRTDPGETCDDGNLINGDGCSSTCKIETTSGGGTIPVQGPGIITFPNGGILEFGPNKEAIIGKGMNLFTTYDTVDYEPYIYNNSDYTFRYDALCITKTNGVSLNGATTQCKNIGILYPYDRVELTGTDKPNYVGGTVTGNSSFGENTLVTTIKENGVLLDNAYFVAKLNVKVSKPAVATTGGGTSYLKNTDNVADVSAVAGNNDNKNFVGVGVSNGDISSYSEEITDNVSVNSVDNESNETNTNANTISEDSGNSNDGINHTDLSDFGPYNGIEGAYIIKDTNFVIDSDNLFSTITKPRTYIIENGNLIINKDIFANHKNIAFVVKNGDIIIGSGVEKLDGTYININGNIQGVSSLKQLNVNGSLYGNIDNLTSNRTYVKQNDNGQIDVGTVVSFGSSLFRKPAPLVSSFINEYVESEKVAK